jgi:hypothetical protein
MGGGLPEPANRPMPHYRPAPERPPLPGHPAATGHPRAAGQPVAEAVPVAESTPAAGVSRVPGTAAVLRRPVAAGGRAANRPPGMDWPPAPDYPAVPHYLSVRNQSPVPDWPPATPMGYRALPRRLAGLLPRGAAARGTAGRRAAVLGYLTVPLFPVPLVIYLTTLRRPGWARQHAAQAVNVWFTGLLYDLAAVIMGAMLALGSAPVALAVFAPLVAARWLVTLGYLVRAARAAGRGAACTFPAWLCMRAAR